MTDAFNPITFPRDELVHDHSIEWWYLNGNVVDTEGNDYALMNCLFRANVEQVKIPFLKQFPVNVLYFYHSLISDTAHQKWYPSFDHMVFVTRNSFTDPLLSVQHYNPNVLAETGYSGIVSPESFVYHVKDRSMDLVMTAVKPPLLIGGEGYLDLVTKSTYYYSLPCLQTTGKIKVDDTWIEVTGKSWMDHQWANAAYSNDQWTWFSLHLDSGEELLCFEYVDEGIVNRIASISYADGKTAHATHMEFVPGERLWKSPKSQVTYLLDWVIRIPEFDIELCTEATMVNQEMTFGSIQYWEGPVRILGRIGDQTVTGKGFMELTGYPAEIAEKRYGGVFAQAHESLMRKIKKHPEIA